MTRFVPLQTSWPTNGMASVVVACLEDAGFHPVIECDPRGWLQFRGWPLGSQRPVTIWVPHDEFGEASAFLDAPFDALESEPEHGGGFWRTIADHRKLIFLAWLASMIMLAT